MARKSATFMLGNGLEYFITQDDLGNFIIVWNDDQPLPGTYSAREAEKTRKEYAEGTRTL